MRSTPRLRLRHFTATPGATSHAAWVERPWPSIGALYRTTGTAWDQQWDTSRLSVGLAGRGRIDFGYNGAAIATLTVDGRTVVKAVRRQTY